MITASLFRRFRSVPEIPAHQPRRYDLMEADADELPDQEETEPAREPETCVHCHEICDLGYLLVRGPTGAESVCHNRERNCYVMVTVHNHQLYGCPKCQKRSPVP